MLALTGIFPFAGFWSKDLILDSLHVGGLGGLQLVATITAGLTALYMGRAWLLTFFGKYRGHAHPTESPKVMTVPLVFLAAMSVIVGAAFYWGAGQGYLGHWLGLHGELHIELSMAIVSIGVAIAGYLVSIWVFGKGFTRAEGLRARFAPLHALLTNKYYIDDFYLWLVRSVQQSVARVCRFFEETLIVRGLVGVPTNFTRWAGDRLRGLQVGRLNFYAYCFFAGVTLLFFILFFLMPGGAR
jgi:NADH-quinone oxidoreductase subunit L